VPHTSTASTSLGGLGLRTSAAVAQTPTLPSVLWLRMKFSLSSETIIAARFTWTSLNRKSSPLASASTWSGSAGGGPDSE
jgi:hypothetical protein